MGNLSNVCDCSVEHARLEYDIHVFTALGKSTRTHNLLKFHIALRLSLKEKRLSGKIEFLSQIKRILGRW